MVGEEVGDDAAQPSVGVVMMIALMPELADDEVWNVKGKRKHFEIAGRIGPGYDLLRNRRDEIGGLQNGRHDGEMRHAQGYAALQAVFSQLAFYKRRCGV